MCHTTVTNEKHKGVKMVTYIIASMIISFLIGLPFTSNRTVSAQHKEFKRGGRSTTITFRG